MYTKPVSEESNKRGGDEDGEGENHVDQGDVDVSDADVLHSGETETETIVYLHVYGEVGEEGKGGSGKEEESELVEEKFEGKFWET